MGFKKLLKRAARGAVKAIKAGGGLALSGVPGGSVAEKLLRLKEAAGDRKRALLAAKVARGKEQAATTERLKKLKPVAFPKPSARSPRAGVLSPDAAKIQALHATANDLVTKGGSELARETKTRQHLSLKKRLEKRTRGFSKTDWQDLADRYKSSNSSKSWEEWLDAVV